MPMFFTPVFTPAEELYGGVTDLVKRELERVGVMQKQVGIKGIEDVKVFKKDGKPVIAFEYGYARIWTIEAKRAMELLSLVPDSAGLEKFWDVVMYMRVGKTPALAPTI